MPSLKAPNRTCSPTEHDYIAPTGQPEEATCAKCGMNPKHAELDFVPIRIVSASEWFDMMIALPPMVAN